MGDDQEGLITRQQSFLQRHCEGKSGVLHANKAIVSPSRFIIVFTLLQVCLKDLAEISPYFKRTFLPLAPRSSLDQELEKKSPPLSSRISPFVLSEFIFYLARRNRKRKEEGGGPSSKEILFSLPRAPFS